MDVFGRQVRLLDPGYFWRKMTLLVTFTLAFLPLKYYQLVLPLKIYVGILILLHIYFVFALIWRVRWKVLAEHRGSFGLRMFAVAVFVVILTLSESGTSFFEFTLFLGFHLVVHTGLLLSLNLVARPRAGGVPNPVRG